MISIIKLKKVCMYTKYMCVHVCLCVSTVVLCASIKPTSVTSTSSQPQGWLCWAEDLGFLDIANEGAQQKTLGL